MRKALPWIVTFDEYMPRIDTVRLFRQRLEEAMRHAGVNRTRLAKASGVDRSTLSQLLAPDVTRLPRADTIAAIAGALRVSADWLLGLSADARGLASILEESFEIAHRPRTEVDENLARWHEESTGYKIRYVPSTLPDLAKTDAVLRFEFSEDVTKTADQAIAASHQRLATSRMPETDMEVCMPRQALESFAAGVGVWSGLAQAHRREQLERLIALTEELYPRLRIYLYDGLAYYSAPYTLFGPMRAALFIGQMYFVFNTTEHIRVLSRHFDELVRAAEVHAHAFPDFVRGLE